MPQRERGRSKLLPWMGGMLLGATLALSVPMLRWLLQETGGADLPEETPLPTPTAHVAGADDKALPMSGEVYTTIRDFALDDPEGNRVLQIGKLHAQVDIDALRGGRLLLPKGEAEGIHLLVRRGPSGQVSLSEALHGGAPPAPEPKDANPDEGLSLDIGPLVAKDIRLTIAVSDNPVIVHVRRAKLQVQRRPGSGAPRIFLSQIEGRLVKPNPLPHPIEIHDGVGVVDLDEGPLVDMRVRVCLARGELRLQVRVPVRQAAVTTLVADADHFMGRTAMAALNVVDWFKDSIEVEHGPVSVPGDRECTR